MLLVVGNEKFFDLRQQSLADIFDCVDIFMLIGVDADAHQPVVRLRLALLRLLRPDDADQTHLDKQPACAGASINTRISRGSPSSARVDGIKPKSNGNIMPSGSRPANMKRLVSGS